MDSVSVELPTFSESRHCAAILEVPVSFPLFSRCIQIFGRSYESTGSRRGKYKSPSGLGLPEH